MNQDNIYAALARAQATFEVASETGKNQYNGTFSTYTDLVAASRKSLVREGLSVSQFLDHDKETDIIYFVTNLNHTSKEVITSKAPIFLKDRSDIQKFGSAITYMQRYMYRTICGVGTTEKDDDGEIASAKNEKKQEEQEQKPITDNQLAFIKKLLNGNAEREAKICARHGIDKLDKLLSRDASEVIKILNAPAKE